MSPHMPMTLNATGPVIGCRARYVVPNEPFPRTRVFVYSGFSSAYGVMAYVAMAYIVMAYVFTVYVIMAYVVMTDEKFRVLRVLLDLLHLKHADRHVATQDTMSLCHVTMPCMYHATMPCCHSMSPCLVLMPCPAMSPSRCHVAACPHACRHTLSSCDVAMSLRYIAMHRPCRHCPVLS